MVALHDIDERSQVFIKVSVYFLKVLGDPTGQDVNLGSPLTPCVPQVHNVPAVWTHLNSLFSWAYPFNQSRFEALSNRTRVDLSRRGLTFLPFPLSCGS